MNSVQMDSKHSLDVKDNSFIKWLDMTQTCHVKTWEFSPH